MDGKSEWSDGNREGSCDMGDYGPTISELCGRGKVEGK